MQAKRLFKRAGFVKIMPVDLVRLARYFYSRKDIQKAIAENSKNREVVPRYLESFGKRPDIIEYPSDVANLAEKGATSFHFSEEIWNNPLDLAPSLTPEKLNSLRKGWDLILDIDSKFLNYSSIAAELIIEALKFHNIQNVGIKFSGRAGWHILVPFEAFPKEVHGIEIKDWFPQGPRIISMYLRELIENSLRERLLEIADINGLSARLNKPQEDFYKNEKFNPFSIVDIDSVAISPRHLIRMPYSINEKSGFASIVILPNQLKSFHIGWAKPERVFPKPYFPKQVEKNEAWELMLQALDWHKMQDKSSPIGKGAELSKTHSEFKGKENIDVKNVGMELWPPCIHNAMKGIKDDGRKRTLFIMLNFFRSINMPSEEIKQKVYEWNKNNAQPLKEGYIEGQLKWHLSHKSVFPPSCIKVQTDYKDTGICTPDFFCSKIKNPAQYTLAKYRMKFRQQNEKGEKEFKKRGPSQRKEQGETREFRGRIN